MTPQFSRSGPVYACRDGDHVVALDLGSGRYFAAPAIQVLGAAGPGLERLMFTEAVAPSVELALPESPGGLPVDAGHCVRFFMAVAKAAVLLRFRSLGGIVARVRRRTPGELRGSSRDGPGCHELAALFARLRPFLFTGHDRCLFESLALLEFLAMHGRHPRWVFAVRARPFAAHCWVQDGPVLLNDTLESVSGFTPIMRV
jgi:hypothetical protein